MKLITSRAIRALIRTSLINATPPNWIGAVSSVMPSDQDSETYAWLSDVPALREWKGGRHLNELTEFGIEIKNVPFEASLRFKKKDLRQDKLGQIELRIGELGRRAGTHWGKLATDILVANPTSYDKQSFFSTAHVEGDSGVQSNDITVVAAAPTNPTVAEFKTAVLQAVTKILSFKDGAGEPVGEDASEFMVINPTHMMESASAALNNATIVESGGAVTNSINSQDDFKISKSTNARLASDSEVFYLARTDTPIPAIILQEEFGPNIEAQAEGSAHAFSFNEHLFGVDANRAAGPGRWQNMVRVTFVSS